MNQKKYLLMATLPHSGEEIPPEAHWLQGLEEVVLMGDVDRYVDRLYESSLEALEIPFVKTTWHRYAADLNRLSSDVDCESVEGHSNPVGSFPRGFHWTYSTQGVRILKEPLSVAVHEKLIDRVYKPFHSQVNALATRLLASGPVFHLDLHSMPSRGTAQHRDPGEWRKDVVVSDSKGQSCDPFLKDQVIEAFQREGFSVAYNWPYFGGRITEQYGRPAAQHHVIQVELNRSLYMNEETKQLNPQWTALAQRLQKVLVGVKNETSG